MIIQLPAIRESTEDFEQIEKRIKDLLKREIYFPMLAELQTPKAKIENAYGDYKALVDALFSGRVTYSRGIFSGKFSSHISKDLRALGAVWESRTGTFRILQAKLPMEIRGMISATESRFKERLDAIDRKLAQVVPAQIADKLKTADIFDRALWKTNKEFKESVKRIGIPPQFTKEMRERIATEWQGNMRLWIQKWTEEEIISLRKEMQKSVFAGNRYESAVKTIQKSYGVSENKAKFLARQETKLLMSKFKETRYADYGIKEYTWHHVAGSPLHPVGPQHRKLGEASAKGTIYRYDQPPVTSEPGTPERRNNPGEDYNCRCYSRAVIRTR